MKPRIGISMNYHDADYGVESAYIDLPYFSVIEEFGALPFPICPTDNIVQLNSILGHLDGVMFTGGGDIDSALWGERLHKKTNVIHPRRQRFELLLYEQVRKIDQPVLALCLGMQLINVAHGGSIHQHLPDLDLDDDVDHGNQNRLVEHTITLDSHSKLIEWVQTECVSVNSGHHQAINKLGDGLTPLAVADDQIIEAYKASDYPFLLAVQWHPERDLANPLNRLIFDKFFQAAAQSLQKV